MKMENHKLNDNEAMQQYEFELDGQPAVIEYVKPREGTIYLTYTYVPEPFRGRGIGTQLVEAVLEDIRRQGLALVPQCAFVARHIRRNPQWEELILREIQI